jgi:Bacterial capsule synthesis protein PGA_cap
VRIAAVFLVALFVGYLVLLGQTDDVETIAVVVTTTVAPSTTSIAPSTTTTSTPPTTTTVPETTTTSAPVEWNLLAGGDVLMDRGEAAGVDMFAGIDPALASADISMVNVEMAISTQGTPVPGKKFTFRAPPSAAEHIGQAGVDIATLGNNHARDYGEAAMLETIELLESNGVQVVGAGVDEEEAFAAEVIMVGDVSVAFVGATYILPGNFSATDERSGVASGKDPGVLAAAVAKAAEENDVVIATLHWGIERRTCENDQQRDVAAELFAAGATVVIGQHPHIMQPIVMEEGKLVAYSLGNFLWHARPGRTGETGVLELKFLGDQLTGYEFYPHVLDSNGAPVPAQPGVKYDRITDIISGDCLRHDPDL